MRGLGSIILTYVRATGLKKNIVGLLKTVEGFLEDVSRRQRLQYGKDDLYLPELIYIYNYFSRGIDTPAHYLLLGVLVAAQEQIIEERLKLGIDKAQELFHVTQPPSVPAPVYSESGSDFFDKMRLTAPWLPSKQ